MKKPYFFQLPAISVVDVTGADAAKIVNNLTTNRMMSLADGEGCETFVTDVRGKTVGHVYLFRHQESIRLFGCGGQSERLVAHLERYTITEDAVPQIRDAEFVAIALNPPAVDQAEIDFPAGGAASVTVADGPTVREVYPVAWLGPHSGAILLPREQLQTFLGWLEGRGIPAGAEIDFHRSRVLAGFPWYGIDLDDSNLPQEIDRDSLAICFRKGCYLGQETVARLDALGQVQRKLVRWRIEGAVPEPGAVLTAGDKTVGRLTSVAATEAGETIALGFARRTHFEPGAVAAGEGFTGRVIGSCRENDPEG